MTLRGFLNRIVNDASRDAYQAYRKESHRDARNGLLAGFKACGEIKTVPEVREILVAATAAAEEAAKQEADDLVFVRHYLFAVTWVANVLSVGLVSEGLDPIVPITDRAAKKAAEILGVRHE